MELIERAKCCICKSENFEKVLEIPMFPVLMGTTLQDASLDVFHDLKWGLCSACGCIQLLELIPLTILYSQQHSAGSIGKIWEKHHEEFARFILSENPESICELGSAHGVLSQIILDSRPEMEYTIIEPSPVNIDPRITTIVGIAEDHLNVITQSQAVVHSHVLEHVYNVQEFVSSISSAMKVGAKMFISFPNIQELIETGGSNSLNFEHTYYLHPIQLNYLLAANGLIIEKQESYLRHSYFVQVIKSKTVNSQGIPLESIRERSLSFVDMWGTLNDFVTHTNKALVTDVIPTYIFGAHVFSQALISMGLNVDEIEGILDNSTAKVGQRLYGTHLIVSNPSIIQKLARVRVILKASHYQDEVKKQLKALNPLVEICE